MRLLHTKTQKLVNVPSHDPPPYAILSHTWGPPEDEVLYEDIVSGPQSAEAKASFLKLRYTCEQARKEDLEYCWIDTCCIDKSSSAELQEAINSMFAWYRKAKICYVYLSDVTDERSTSGEDSQFHCSRWFTRGWTLQELIAPVQIGFYTKDWVNIGTKLSLINSLLSVTKIPLGVFLSGKNVKSRCIAERMSWASSRQTSRPEDMAYCLMGIFSVYMPMLYGEGERAFSRLQEEIIKRSDDHSIFAWRDPNWDPRTPHGLLADRPSQFVHSSGMQLAFGRSNQEPFSMTNRGLQIEAHLYKLILKDPWMPLQEVYAMSLMCHTSHEPGADTQWYFVGILLSKADGSVGRINVGQFVLMGHLTHTPKRIFIKSMESFEDDPGNFSRCLPEHPAVCRYSIDAGAANESLQREVSIRPMLLSDVDSKEWSTICWTVQGDSGQYSSRDFISIHLSRDDGEVLTAQLGATCKHLGSARDLDYDAFYPGSFHAVHGNKSDANFFEIAQVTGQAQFLQKHIVRVFCDPISKSMLLKRPGGRDVTIPPVFVLQVWDSEDTDWLRPKATWADSLLP